MQARPGERSRRASSLAPAGQAQGGDPSATAAIARRIDAALQEATARLLRHTTELAVAAAEALVGADARYARAALEVALKEALASLIGAVRVRIRVHPSQVHVVEALTAEVGHCVQVAIEADEDISPGGCIVSCELGEVDATMESRLRRLREAVEEEIGR